MNSKTPSGKPSPCFKQPAKRNLSGAVQLEEASKVPGTDVTVPPAAGALEVGKRFNDYFSALYSSNEFVPLAWYLREVDLGKKDIQTISRQIFRLNNVKETIQTIKGGKTGADDELIIEMLQALPKKVLLILATLFQERFAGDKVDKDIWKHVVVILIPKVKSPKNI